MKIVFISSKQTLQNRGGIIIMEKRSSLLSYGALAIISAALFSGHFGVGDVIFPEKGQERPGLLRRWGMESSTAWASWWPISPSPVSRKPCSR
jgi:hypothetical protein